MINCLCCGEETTNPKYCSRSCAAKESNQSAPKRKRTAWKTSECRGCGKSFEYRDSQSSGHYCSNACQWQHSRRELVEHWKSGKLDACGKNGRLNKGIRKYLIKEANHQCSKCGWNKVNPVSGKCPLEIDHIDGNAENCRPENLRVLCPNCHSLTPTWKALNSGNGSKKRLKYGKLI